MNDSGGEESDGVFVPSSSKKRKGFGRMRDVAKKIRLQSHEQGSDCKCRKRCFDNISFEDGNWTDTILPVSDSFLPDVEQYLPKTPLQALREGSFLKVPVLTGITSNEGDISLGRWGDDLIAQGYSQMLLLFINSILPSVMSRYGFHNHNSKAEISSILQWQYIDSVVEGDMQSLTSQMIQFYTDAQFKAPLMKQLKLLSGHNTNVYAYQFDQSGLDLYGNNFNTSGAGHGTDLMYLFGPSLIQSVLGRRLSPAEERLSIAMKRIWAEFIRQGQFGSNPYSYGVSWRKYSPEEDNVALLNTQTGGPASFDSDATSRYRISLWNELLPRILNLTAMQTPPDNTAKGMHLTTDQPYRSAMYTLIGFVMVLLVLLIVCVILLKRRAKERERDLF